MLKSIYFKIVILSLLSFTALAKDQKYVQMGLTTLLAKGQHYLVVNFKNEKKWHTYWKNPGDAGLTMKMSFSVGGSPINLEEATWPSPKRYIEQGNMWAYGYGNQYSLFFKLPNSLKDSRLKVLGEWLVCKDICIPGQEELTISLDSNLEGRSGSYYSQEIITKQFNSLPESIEVKPENFKVYLSRGRTQKELALSYTIEHIDLSQLDTSSSVLIPYPLNPLTYKHEEIYIDEVNKTLYGRIYIDWDGEYEEPIWQLPKDGIFKKKLTAKFLLQYPKSQNAKIITHIYDQFSLSGDNALTQNFKSFSKLNSDGTLGSTKGSSQQKSIFYYILFAFLGGLILNLMPCVLPVISLKLFGLIVHSDESRAQILKHNLAYTAGVLFSFLSLGSVVYFIKISGDQVGWGFQLQSPIFVFIMLVLIFVMAMNMLGLFEFYTPGGKKLGNAQLKKGTSADFMNGVLATILSTPCSAPFLGTALTFAFTTSNSNIFIIFLSVGIGLAFPFIITGIFPSLIKFLPKPGMWMDKLKKILGLSLLITSIWLYDVLSVLIDMGYAGMYINTILLMIFFSFYFRKYISKNIFWNAVMILIPIALLLSGFKQEIFEQRKVTQNSKRSELDWQRWSPQKISQPNGYTFINFTASWCLTCKVNKKIVLESDDFKELIKTKNLRLLEGDWTKRDQNITNFLRSYDIVGVPAYFIQKPTGEIVSLGETISIAKIKSHIK